MNHTENIRRADEADAAQFEREFFTTLFQAENYNL